jgi:hypothetical protein
MPRINKTEQTIINLMDEYADCLVCILQLDSKIFDAIDNLNNDIEEGLIKKGFSRNDENSPFEDARHCVIALYISGGMDNRYETGDLSKSAWLALSRVKEEIDQKFIPALVEISSNLLKTFDLTSALFGLVGLDKMMQVINLIEQPFYPIYALNKLCAEEFIQLASWRKKRKLESDGQHLQISGDRVWLDKEFNNIADFMFLKSSENYTLIDSNNHRISIDGNILKETTALLIPNDLTNSSSNPEDVDKLEKLLHQMITWKLKSPKIELLENIEDNSSFVEFISPSVNYKRKLISHKGSIIGLYSAIYAQLAYKVSTTTINDALKDVSEVMLDIGFSCRESTIQRVRKEHLKIFNKK